jgi:RNA polymerase sigma-70 factor (ECF subfamily)
MPARWRVKKMEKKQKLKSLNDSDKELIDAINSGRTDLFNELVIRYEKRLYNFGMKICRDTSDAEDLVQDTFINVFKYLRGFRQETLFKNWLYTIAARVCAKMRRKSKYAPDYDVVLEDIENYMPDEHHEVNSNRQKWAQKPIESLMNKEISTKIKEAVKKLPPKYRLVIVLRDMEGFSTEETSEILEISPANVKVRLFRARLYLRDALDHIYSH